MNVDVEPRQDRWSRLLLLAGGVGLAWCALTTFGQYASASAAEDDSSGLLGVVSSTVQQTTSAATNVVDTVEPVVVDVIQTVAPPAPVPAPPPQAPAPAVNAPTVAPTPNVTPVVQVVSNVATTTVSDLAGATTSILSGTADTADALTESVANSTAAIVSKVSIAAALDRLLATIDGLPLLGDVTSGAGLRQSAGSTVSVVDHLIAVVAGPATAIVGNPGQSGAGGILPLPDSMVPESPLPGDETHPIQIPPTSTLQPAASTAPLTAQQALVFGGFFAGALVVGSVVPITSSSSSGSGGSGWPHAPSAPAGSPGLLSAGASAAASLFWALVEFSWRVHPHGAALHSLSDDALPGAPVFATDVSPD